MVLIGANGAGKTSFLDAMTLLSASASGELNAAISRLGGLSVCCHAAGAILIPGDRDGGSWTRAAGVRSELSTKGAGYYISKEYMTQSHPGHEAPFKHIESGATISATTMLKEAAIAPRVGAQPARNLVVSSPQDVSAARGAEADAGHGHPLSCA